MTEPSLWVRDQLGRRLLLTAHEEWLTLDAWRGAADGWERVRDIPLAEVRSLEVEAIQDTHVSFGFITSLIGTGKRNPAITGVLVMLTSGEHVMLVVDGKAPIEVRAVLGSTMLTLRDR